MKTFNKSLKIKLLVIAALGAAMVATLSAFFGTLVAKADRLVTMSGSSTLFTTANGAQQWAHKEHPDDENSDEYYFMMAIPADGTVQYKKNLAYQWWYDASYVDKYDFEYGDIVKDGEKTVANPVAAKGLFNLSFGFEELNFEKFVIEFQSQQYAKDNKDAKTANYLVFVPAKKDGAPNNKLTVITARDLDAVKVSHAEDGSAQIEIKDGAKAEKLGDLESWNKIYFRFTGRDGADYVFDISNSDGASGIEGRLKNVGGNYVSYSSSSVIPLTFKADLPEKAKDGDGEAKEYAKMVLYSMNGQSFRLGGYSNATSSPDMEKLSSYYVKNANGKYVKVPEGATEKIGTYTKVDPDKVNTSNLSQYYTGSKEEGFTKVPDGAEYDETKDYYTYDAAMYYTFTSATSSSPVKSVNGADGKLDHYEGGRVFDDNPPVLCLEKGLNFIETGAELSFSNFKVIDVMGSSTAYEAGYYILDNEQAGDEQFEYNDYNDEKLFRKVKDSDDQYMIWHADSYVLQPSDYNANVYGGEGFKLDGAVKVYVKITDSTASESTYVLLDWFVPEEYKLKVNSESFIGLAKDNRGAAFKYVDDVNSTNNIGSESGASEWDALVADYQAKVDEAAKGLKAGSQNYFYLPTFESLLSDNATAYSNLSFTVYYYNRDGQKNTSGTSSTLSITLNQQGRYVFTIYAEDAAKNEMYYYKDGEIVTFPKGDVWKMWEDKDDEGLAKLLPWFEFEVEDSEISLKDPGEQNTAYKDTSYTVSVSNFEINAINYNASYELYLFNDAVCAADKNVNIDYAYFMAHKEELFKENKDDWFTPIMQTNQSSEDGYKDSEKYSWSGSSFIPQESNAYYLVVCKVQDTVSKTRPPVYGYMGILSSEKPASLKGEDTWVQDNLTSIILLSIAGASAIGIVLLLVIKPKNSGDLDDVNVSTDSKKKAKKKVK